MFLASCATALDDDAVLECWGWIDEQLKCGTRVVVIFEHATSCEAVRSFVPASPLLDCLHITNCTSHQDFVVFAALYAVSHQAAPTDLFRFTGSRFESLALELERASNLFWLASEISDALSKSQPNRAMSALGMLRSALKSYPGTLSAAAYQRAGQCKVLIDAFLSCHQASLPDGTLTARSRLKPIETWNELFPLLDTANAITAIASWSEGAQDLQRFASFVHGGRLAFESDVKAMQKGQYPTLTVMLWLAAYLVRTSEHHLVLEDGAAAVAISVCALEVYVDFRLFELNLLAFDSLAKALQRTSAAEALFEKYRRDGHGQGIKAALMILSNFGSSVALATSEVEEVIQLRNRCIFTHGVQRLSVNDATVAVARVKAFIKLAESRLATVDKRWTNLLASSFAVNLKSIGATAFSSLLA